MKATPPWRSLAAVPAGATISSVLGVFAASITVASAGVHDMDNPTSPPREWAASFRWENDKAGGTDRFYTDGFSLALSHTGPSWMDPVTDWLPWGEGRRTVGYELVQAMFTPSDTEASVPDPDDRPYAGVLTTAVTLHVERDDSYHGLKFLAGVVGPWSLAEETQNEFHNLIGVEQSEGWDYQLENEVIFNLAYEYRHRYHLTGDPDRWSLKALPLAGGWLGNMLVQGQIGGILSYGYNMPDDFGPTLVRGMGHMPPPRHDAGAQSDAWGYSVYAGSVANLVLRDITLDGNTFEDSASVDKEYFVPMAGVGVTVGNRRFQAAFAYIFWGKEFEDQDNLSKFGALTLNYYF